MFPRPCDNCKAPVISGPCFKLISIRSSAPHDISAYPCIPSVVLPWIKMLAALYELITSLPHSLTSPWLVVDTFHLRVTVEHYMMFWLILALRCLARQTLALLYELATFLALLWVVVDVCFLFRVVVQHHMIPQPTLAFRRPCMVSNARGPYKPTTLSYTTAASRGYHLSLPLWRSLPSHDVLFHPRFMVLLPLRPECSNWQRFLHVRCIVLRTYPWSLLFLGVDISSAHFDLRDSPSPSFLDNCFP
ncbi:hypothetical protein BDR04DRAFT_668804 [Suillus decipiens]|nr:hypothetical protein BDR04DRAFT_668804 [Suillus decipiens]